MRDWHVEPCAWPGDFFGGWDDRHRAAESLPHRIAAGAHARARHARFRPPRDDRALAVTLDLSSGRRRARRSARSPCEGRAASGRRRAHDFLDVAAGEGVLQTARITGTAIREILATGRLRWKISSTRVRPARSSTACGAFPRRRPRPRGRGNGSRQRQRAVLAQRRIPALDRRAAADSAFQTQQQRRSVGQAQRPDGDGGAPLADQLADRVAGRRRRGSRMHQMSTASRSAHQQQHRVTAEPRTVTASLRQRATVLASRCATPRTQSRRRSSRGRSSRQIQAIDHADRERFAAPR